MSDYTLAVAWSGKDALADSDAAKVISGADFNTEFTTVRTAVNSKADLNGDATEAFAMNNATVAGTLAVTGIPTAPTAAEGTNTTQLATTAFVKTAADALNSAAYPVGAIFTTTVAYADSAAVVAAIGGTTWAAFGAGKVLVGLDSGDTDFDTAEETGGAKTHTLTTGEIPAHTHTQAFRVASTDSGISTPGHKSGGGDSTQTSSSTGGGGAHANVQPYIVVYFWKRTA
jgi:hypothetical protein